MYCVHTNVLRTHFVLFYPRYPRKLFGLLALVMMRDGYFMLGVVVGVRPRLVASCAMRPHRGVLPVRAASA